MNLDFQAQLSLLKQKKAAERKDDNSKGYIKYKDIIEEKLKQNKEETVLRKFKYEEPKNNKNADSYLNTDNDEKEDILNVPPIKKRKIDNKKVEEIGSTQEREKEEKENIQNEEKEKDLSINSKKEKKEYKISIVPSEIIKEVKEQDTIKRVIYPDEYSYEYKCDQLYNWFHLTFFEWEKELEELILSNSEEVKSRIGQYKQCRGYIKTLLVNLKEKKVTKVILDKLFQVMVFCIDGDYIRANDNYIELSIGNAPWPMGVTMVGIHERSGRSKIYTSQVAYILNDDITKKYLQSVKRVMSFIQRRYPKSPSKCVYS